VRARPSSRRTSSEKQFSGAERVLFLAHRHELIVQASRKLGTAGLEHGIIKAGFPLHLNRRVQVASVQTLHARAFRSRKIELSDFELVIIDEAHHSRAMTYQQVVDAFPNAVIIGMTATPVRGDGRGLGNIFDDLIEGPPVNTLIRNGHLVGTKVFAPSRPDLSGVHTRNSDYVIDELATAMNRQGLVGDVVTHWLLHAADRRTVVFAVNRRAQSAYLR
jgi:superfamily II DNA or RNA helicase